MDVLRRILFESARNALGPRVIDVLVTDIARQDS
jgi:flagellar protein FliL